MLPIVVSVVLIKEEDKIKKPVYYVSKVVLRAETRYLSIKKLTYTLIIMERKIYHYFQTQPIIVLINQPFKYILK